MDLHFTKRSRAKRLAIGMLVIMTLFVIRLFYIQVIQHDYYVKLADSEQVKPFILHAARGEIYTMDGSTPTKLVMNETVYTVWIDPTQIDSKSDIVSAVKQTIGGNTRDNFEQYFDIKDSRYQVIATKVSRTQAEILKQKNFAGLGFSAVSRRVYPEGSLAAQVLGFVDAEGSGKYGFEQANDSELKGEDGLLKTVTDIRGVPLTVSDKNIKIPAKNGTNYVLTIDRNIQSKAEQALADGLKRTGATQGSVVVMDPMTGKVWAMANLPTYDPNDIQHVTDVGVFNNNSMSNPYEPASVIKTVAMSTGIDKGIMTPESTYNNTDYITIDDKTIQNASKGQTGTITMQHVLNWSLNTGTVTMAQWLGNGSINRYARDTLYDYYHSKFRLGSKTGIELAGEQAGTVVSPEDVEGNAIRYANMTFGQGLDVTTLQTAAAFCAVVNGGVYYQPTIIAGTISDNATLKEAVVKTSERIIKQSTSDTMRGMIQTARHAFGNAGDKPGYDIGGKTGTAQTVVKGEYVFNQTIGTYVGYGAEKGGVPSYVIMTQLFGPDMNLQGGRDAQPIYTDISNWMIDYQKLSPHEG